VEDAPWSDLGYNRTLTPKKLYDLLRGYDVEHKKSIRVEPKGPVVPGFERAAFEDAWARWLPEPGPIADEPGRPAGSEPPF
jgi:Protein of unknown function (DUF3631)